MHINLYRLLGKCKSDGVFPDPKCTPGEHTTDDKYVICMPRYSTDHRSVSALRKALVFQSYGILVHKPGQYEIDHLIPLELGGTNSMANLWPQPVSSFRVKDKVENEQHDVVCTGRKSLAQAQKDIATNWVSLITP